MPQLEKKKLQFEQLGNCSSFSFFMFFLLVDVLLCMLFVVFYKEVMNEHGACGLLVQEETV
jgi:hypothetical protein